ncbi:MAG TPA: hypothetical protein VLG16_02020 [Candidatus Saccharimonadales bacterium]|nr:hypothetical protein [Candidatus Saccharimonadales bacterium]
MDSPRYPEFDLCGIPIVEDSGSPPVVQQDVTPSIEDAVDARLEAANINPLSLSESAGYSDEEGVFDVALLSPWVAYGGEAYDGEQRRWPWGNLYE